MVWYIDTLLGATSGGRRGPMVIASAWRFEGRRFESRLSTIDISYEVCSFPIEEDHRYICTLGPPLTRETWRTHSHWRSAAWSCDGLGSDAITERESLGPQPDPTRPITGVNLRTESYPQSPLQSREKNFSIAWSSSIEGKKLFHCVAWQVLPMLRWAREQQRTWKILKIYSLVERKKLFQFNGMIHDLSSGEKKPSWNYSTILWAGAWHHKYWEPIVIGDYREQSIFQRRSKCF